MICTGWECYPEEAAALGLRTRNEGEWTQGRMERHLDREAPAKSLQWSWEASTGTQKRVSLAAAQIVEQCGLGVEDSVGQVKMFVLF